LNQDSQLEFESMEVGEGLKGAIRTSIASDEREVDRLKQEIDQL
tara:strand:+ start:463 stop:594 length:132 start_codon:yes stop_codon:yes gene_type:complete